MNAKKRIKIVIVEDDIFFNKSLEKYVQSVCNSSAYSSFDFEIKTYLTAHDCLRELEKDTSIMFLDYYLINMYKRTILSGADVLNRVKKTCPGCKVIMVSSLSNIQTAIELMRRGIYEFVTKNRNSHERVGEVLERLLRDELHALKQQQHSLTPPDVSGLRPPAQTR